MLQDNYAEYDRNKTWGVPRDGKALLHGIAYCGECGHKICVQYNGSTQYLFNHLKQQHGTPVCQLLRGDSLDDQVVEWFFEALSVADIDAASQALRDTDAERDHVLQARRQQVERPHLKRESHSDTAPPIVSFWSHERVQANEARKLSVVYLVMSLSRSPILRCASMGWRSACFVRTWYRFCRPTFFR